MTSKGYHTPEDRLMFSSWTPLTDYDKGKKRRLYGERSHLILKWFDMWSGEERESLLVQLFSICSLTQQRQFIQKIDERIPKGHVDFLQCLPRALSLHILSFLDPRSLCRASQVSSRWKYMCEANEIWAAKCLKLGWALPSQFPLIAHGIYKRLYVNNMHYLRIDGPLELENLNKVINAKAIELAEKERQTILEEERKQKKIVLSRPQSSSTPKHKLRSSIPQRAHLNENCRQSVESLERSKALQRLSRPRSAASTKQLKNLRMSGTLSGGPLTSARANAITQRLYRDAMRSRSNSDRNRVDPPPIRDIVRDVEKVCRDEQLHRLSSRCNPGNENGQMKLVVGSNAGFQVGPPPPPVPKPSARLSKGAPKSQTQKNSRGQLLSRLSPEMIKSLPPPPQYGKSTFESQENPSTQTHCYNNLPMNEKDPNQHRMSLRDTLADILKQVPT